jgi:hypothetical protein
MEKVHLSPTLCAMMQGKRIDYGVADKGDVPSYRAFEFDLASIRTHDLG